VTGCADSWPIHPVVNDVAQAGSQTAFHPQIGMCATLVNASRTKKTRRRIAALRAVVQENTERLGAYKNFLH